jgi:hypothetical protein
VVCGRHLILAGDRRKSSHDRSPWFCYLAPK